MTKPRVKRLRVAADELEPVDDFETYAPEVPVPGEADVVRRLVDRMRAPRRHALLAFEPLDRGTDEAYGRALDAVEAARSEILAGGTPSVLLLGAFGVGKTRAAVRLLAAAYVALKTSGAKLSIEETPLFVKVRELGELRFAFSSSLPEDEADEREELRERVFSTRYLVLDDLGRISGYKGEEEFLERVVESRYENMLPTIATASKSRIESDRLRDFLESGVYRRVIMHGESRRVDDE